RDVFDAGLFCIFRCEPMVIERTLIDRSSNFYFYGSTVRAYDFVFHGRVLSKSSRISTHVCWKAGIFWMSGRQASPRSMRLYSLTMLAPRFTPLESVCRPINHTV